MDTEQEESGLELDNQSEDELTPARKPASNLYNTE